MSAMPHGMTAMIMMVISANRALQFVRAAKRDGGRLPSRLNVRAQNKKNHSRDLERHARRVSRVPWQLFWADTIVRKPLGVRRMKRLIRHGINISLDLT